MRFGNGGSALKKILIEQIVFFLFFFFFYKCATPKNRNKRRTIIDEIFYRSNTAKDNHSDDNVATPREPNIVNSLSFIGPYAKICDRVSRNLQSRGKIKYQLGHVTKTQRG